MTDTRVRTYGEQQNDDQIRCRACKFWDTTTRVRPGIEGALALLCVDCWRTSALVLGICRHCGRKQDED